MRRATLLVAMLLAAGCTHGNADGNACVQVNVPVEQVVKAIVAYHGNTESATDVEATLGTAEPLIAKAAKKAKTPSIRSGLQRVGIDVGIIHEELLVGTSVTDGVRLLLDDLKTVNQECPS